MGRPGSPVTSDFVHHGLPQPALMEVADPEEEDEEEHQPATIEVADPEEDNAEQVEEELEEKHQPAPMEMVYPKEDEGEKLEQELAPAPSFNMEEAELVVA